MCNLLISPLPAPHHTPTHTPHHIPHHTQTHTPYHTPHHTMTHTPHRHPTRTPSLQLSFPSNSLTSSTQTFSLLCSSSEACPRTVSLSGLGKPPVLQMKEIFHECCFRPCEPTDFPEHLVLPTTVFLTHSCISQYPALCCLRLSVDQLIILV